MNAAWRRLLAELERAWIRSDALFALLDEARHFARPIALRHPFVFYLGHLPAFAWNQIGVGALGRPPIDGAFCDLFERGIDPDPATGAAPDPARWPDLAAIRRFRDDVRRELREALPELARRARGDAELRGDPVAHAVIEHELMHHETLLYMLHELPEGALARPPRPLAGDALGDELDSRRTLPDLAPIRVPTLVPNPVSKPVPNRAIHVPAGPVVLGTGGGSCPHQPDDPPFAWDNESPAQRVEVPAFSIDELPVSCGEYAGFVDAGAYAEPRWWLPEDWAWLRREGRELPQGWRRDGRSLRVRELFGSRPLDQVREQPVRVSGAEARAFARWRGARLPSEAEWQRAAHGTPDGSTRAHPWGGGAPDAGRVLAGLRTWGLLDRGSHPAGASVFGIQDLMGGLWEWTASAFAPFPGFRVGLTTYPGYSADFFDGAHLVLLGGSWATDERLLRRSFRNWFRPHYPYVFAGLRLARDA